MQKAFYVLFLFYFLLGMGVSAAVGGIVGGDGVAKGRDVSCRAPACVSGSCLPGWLHDMGIPNWYKIEVVEVVGIIRPGFNGHGLHFSDASCVLEVAAFQIKIAINDAADMAAAVFLKTKDQRVDIVVTDSHILVDHILLGTNADLVIALLKIHDLVGGIDDRLEIDSAGVERVFQVKDVIT